LNGFIERDKIVELCVWVSIVLIATLVIVYTGALLKETAMNLKDSILSYDEIFEEVPVPLGDVEDFDKNE